MYIYNCIYITYYLYIIVNIYIYICIHTYIYMYTSMIGPHLILLRLSCRQARPRNNSRGAPHRTSSPSATCGTNEANSMGETPCGSRLERMVSFYGKIIFKYRQNVFQVIEIWCWIITIDYRWCCFLLL